MALDLIYKSKARITGDRQSGKTELLLALAEKLCRQGQQVLYVTDGWSLARNCFCRMEQSVENLPGYRAYRGSGRERIEHETGGTVHFVSSASVKTFGPVDTLLLDDVRTDYEFSYPDTRVIRATL